MASNRYYVDVEQTENGASASVDFNGTGKKWLATDAQADANGRKNSLSAVVSKVAEYIINRESPDERPLPTVSEENIEIAADAGQ